jgi:hypothetical protein
MRYAGSTTFAGVRVKERTQQPLTYLRHSSITNRCIPSAQAAIIHLCIIALAPESGVMGIRLLRG